MKKAFFLLFLASIVWAIHDITPWRPDYTWLPGWFTSNSALLYMDGYHISGAVMRFLFFTAGWYAAREDSNPLWMWLLVGWLFTGQIMDAFYHTLLMKPEFVECGICIIFRDIWEIINNVL